MNRRQLLLRGALVAALAPVVRAAGVAEFTADDAAARLGARSGDLLLAVHDPAYRRSREFAAALQDRGARVIALEPDALAAWHGTLRAACAAAPGVRITGLTTHTDFMVLRDLARGVGLTTLAERDADAGGLRGRATLIGWVLAPRVVGA
jgi:hypothetical protein